MHHTNQTYTVCHCSHMTSFAVLMDEYVPQVRLVPNLLLIIARVGGKAHITFTTRLRSRSRNSLVHTTVTFTQQSRSRNITFTQQSRSRNSHSRNSHVHATVSFTQQSRSRNSHIHATVSFTQQSRSRNSLVHPTVSFV